MSDAGSQEMARAHSISEKRYPIRALGPPRKVSRWSHTPGMELAASGTDSQQSGLSKDDSE